MFAHPGPYSFGNFHLYKSEWRDSNPQHPAWKASTLPIELHSHKKARLLFFHNNNARLVSTPIKIS